MKCKNNKVRGIFGFLFCVCLIFSNLFAADNKSTIAARINDEVITVDEFERAVNLYNDFPKQDIDYFDDNNVFLLLLTGGDLWTYSFKIITPEQKMNFLHRMVQMRLLYQEALRRGLDKIIYSGKFDTGSAVFPRIFLEGIKNEIVKYLLEQEMNAVTFQPSEIEYLYRLFHIDLGVKDSEVIFSRIDNGYERTILFAKKRVRLQSLSQHLMKENAVVMYGEFFAAQNISVSAVTANNKSH